MAVAVADADPVSVLRPAFARPAPRSPRAPPARFADVTPAQRAAAAGGAYVVTAVVVTPLDRLKTLLQAGNTGAAPGARRAVPLLRELLRPGGGGVRSLYRGLGLELCAAPCCVVYFSLYEENLRRLHGAAAVPPGAAPAAAAVAARSCEVVLRAPLELLKTQAQAGVGAAPAAGAAARRGGIAGLYRGFGLLAARDLGFSATYWSAYEPLRRRARGGGVSALGCGFAGGAAAGAAAALITTPFDVLKTRRQAGDDAPAARIAAAVWRERGLRGLFAGVGPRLLRLPIGLAIFMGAFEAAKAKAAAAPRF